MFDPQQIQQQQAAQGQQSQQQQTQQMYVTTDKKDDKSGQQSTTTEFPFYYNVNMLQKVQANAVGTIGAITTDDKGHYRFDVQPGYNTLINQMNLATNTTFKCDICGLVFGHMSLLNHHKRIHNSTPSNLHQQPLQVVVQTPTTVTVATTPERPYTCDLCGACFALPGELKSHKTNMHAKPKVQICEACGSEDPCEHHPTKIKKTAYLKNHGRVHTGEKPFKCSHCGMQFSQSPHLKNHERIHSGERPYQCEVCEKTFARHSTLWNHRRIHTGEKPYRCNICGSAFNQATHLKNHAKVHTGEKPHRCDICEIGFSDRFALKRHRAIHEKYGQTAARNSQANASNVQANTSAQGQGQPQQVVVVNATTPVTVSQGQPVMLEEVYKCQVAFPEPK